MTSPSNNRLCGLTLLLLLLTAGPGQSVGAQQALPGQQPARGTRSRRCGMDKEKFDILKTIWANRRDDLKAALASVQNGSGVALYNAQVYTQNLLRYAEGCHDLVLLDELADYLLVAFEHLTDLGSHQTWVDQGGDELPTLHISQFLYEVAVAIDAIAALPAQVRTQAMNDLLAYAPVVLEDHYRRWIFEEPLWNFHAWGCDGGAPLRPLGGFSLAAWVRSDDANGWISGLRGTTVVLEIAAGKLSARLISDEPDIDQGTEYTIYSIDGSTPIADGTWHHVALVFRPQQGSLELFVDGAAETSTATEGDLRDIGSQLLIGGYDYGFGACCFLAGAIDDVRMYACDLSEDDVEALAGGAEAGHAPLAHWDFESGGLDSVGPHDLISMPAGDPQESDPDGEQEFLGSTYIFDGVDDFAATYNWEGAHTHEWALRGKAWGMLQNNPLVAPWCHGLTDTDMWVFSGLTELLAAYENEPGLGFLPAPELDAYGEYLAFALNLLESRLVETQVLDFASLPQTGLVLDPGVWDLHAGRAYSSYVGMAFPTPQDAGVAPGTGWDISHARRFVSVFKTLGDHHAVTQQAFPDDSVLEKLANQFIYGTFNRNFDLPLFTNYIDGTDGWYRVGYHGPGFGYGLGDLSKAAYTGGFGFWKHHNANIEYLNEALWELVITADPVRIQHRDEHFGVHWDNYVRVGGLDLNVATSLELLMFLPVFSNAP
jgi:hypothetical protein